MGDLMQSQEKLPQVIESANRATTGISVANKGWPPTPVVGDYVMVTKMPKCGKLPKLMGRGMRPCQLVLANVSRVRCIETVQRKNAHVARKSPHVDSSLGVPQERKYLFTALKDQGEFGMQAISTVSPTDSEEWIVQVRWVGFDEAYISWELEPLHYEDAPLYLITPWVRG